MTDISLAATGVADADHDEAPASPCEPVPGPRRRPWTRVATLIEICRMNGVEPYAWLRNTLERIAAGHPMPRIHDLLPWNFDAGTGNR